MKGYTTFHSRLDNQPGNLISIRKDIAFTPITISSNINALAVRTVLDVLTTICSVCLNPNEILDPVQLNNLISELPKHFILVGDFNARNTFWHDSKSTSRGDLVLDTVLNGQLHIMNGTSSTHYDERTKSYSNINLSVCRLIMIFRKRYFWVTHEDRCGSDHFPILIRKLEYTPETPKGKFNLFKADWPLFTSKTSNISSYDSAKGVKENLTIYENNVIDSAETSIPLSNGCKLHCPVPWWNKEC